MLSRFKQILDSEKRLPIAVLVFGLCLSAYAGWSLQQSIYRDAEAEFVRNSERTSTEISRRLHQPVFGLNGAKAMIDAYQSVTRDKFRAYVESRDLSKEFMGVRGFGFIAHVTRPELANFIDQERADGAPQFALRQLADKTHDDFFVIKIIEPAINNAGAQGLDIGSEAKRREAAQRAVDSGLATITRSITLVQDQRKASGALLFVPVYRRGASINTVAERRAALMGLLYAPIVITELLENMADVTHQHIDFEIFDDSPGKHDTSVMFDADNHLAKSAASGGTIAQRRFTVRQTIAVPGREMTIDINSTPEFDAAIDHLSPWLVFGLGALLSALVALMLRMQATGLKRAAELATGMTEDLARLAQVVKRTANAVSIIDLDNKITWINEGFTRITGYTSQDAIGQTHAALLGQQEDLLLPAKVLEAKAMGTTYRVEEINQAQDGHEFWLETEIQPQYDANDRHTGYMAIGSNVTERRIEKIALDNLVRDNAALLGALNLHAIISIADAAGDIIEVNDAFCQISGYTRTELLGKSHRIVNSGHQSAAFWAEMWQTIGNGKPWRGQVCNCAKDGSRYWVDTFIAPFTNADGQIEKYIAISMDITASQQADEKLRWNQSLMQMMSNSSPLAFLVVDNRTDEILYFNQRFCEIWGIVHLADEMRRGALKNNEIIPDCLKVLADVPAFAASCAPLQDEANRITIEDEIAFINERTVRRFSTQIRDDDDRYYGRFYIFEDITTQRLSEFEAQRNAALLRGSIDALDEAFVLYDPDDRLVFCNDKYRSLYATSADLIVPGARFEDIVRGGAERGQYAEAIERVDEWVAERLTAHLASNSSVVQRLNDGRSLRIVERKMPDGHIVGFRIDITELVLATEAAQAASLSKSQFLANMSHELRTPMNAVLGMLTLLRKTALTARQADYASKSENAARALLTLLNEILDFSKIEAGKMTLDVHPFGMDQVMRDLSVILAANVGKKQLEVLFDIDPALPRELVGDALRLQQVLINLSSNAIKFTAAGEVIISVKVITRSAMDVTLQVGVRDTGIGIAPEHQSGIFAGFTQAEASTTRRFGGTGLGLAISQHLVGLMGGQISLESSLGHGSFFHFCIRLPLQKALNRGDHVTSAASTLVSLSKLSTLIVDDNDTARGIIAQMCASLGWLADTAESGEQALRMMEAKRASATPYDAVFLDWQMPDMDGWQTCQRMHDQDVDNQSPIVVMVTAHDRELLAQRSEADRSMLDGYLVKPITSSMLFDAIHDARAPDGTSRSVVTPDLSEQRLVGMRLLVAEDNLNNQQVVRELLEAEGATLHIANNGQEAIDAIVASDLAFDVVLMDLQMPVMDGLMATRHIRGALAMASLPIVAMTANAMLSDRETCLAAGMNSHIGKPFDLDHLVTVLRQQAGLPGLTAAAKSAAVANTLPSAQTGLTQAVIDAAIAAQIDISTALARLGGKLNIYHRMLRTFARDLGTMPDELRAHLATGERASILRLFHTLKGLAATLGANALASNAAFAENQYATQSDNTVLENEAIVFDMCKEIDGIIPDLSMLLLALQDASELAIKAEPNSGPEEQLDLAAIAGALHLMATQLHNSDMGALDTMSKLHKLCIALAGDQLAALKELDEAVNSLQFEHALGLCTAFGTRLTSE